jgi:hypothetical protein
VQAGFGDESYPCDLHALVGVRLPSS